MDDKKKALIIAAYGFLAFAILWMLFRGCGGGGNVQRRGDITLTSPSVDGPTLLNINIPANPINLGDIIVNAPPPITNSCGCGCIDNSAYANAMQGAVNAYTTNLQELSQLITDAYVASVPPGVRQFFGQSLAAYQYGASQRFLQSMG